MSKLEKIRKKIQALPEGDAMEVTEERGCIVLRGTVKEWNTAVKAGQLAVDQKRYLGVINDIRLEGFDYEAAAAKGKPSLHDDLLEGASPDVLIIGGGITGCSAAENFPGMLFLCFWWKKDRTWRPAHRKPTAV